MIRPVFANTAWVPTFGRLICRGASGRISLPVRCGLVEHPKWGPVLIDAGYGPRVVSDPGRGWALRVYSALLMPKLNPLESPLALLADHGYLPEDVRRVLVTHLHADHVAYLRDLPNARFLVNGPVSGARRHGVFNDLLPMNFADRVDQITDRSSVEAPLGLGAGFDLFGDESVLGVPLPGHLDGHYGLCFPGDQPLLYAVDTQWLLDGLEPGKAPGFPISLTAADRAQWADSTRRVYTFAKAGGEVVLCHDPARTAYDWSPRNV